MSKLFERFARLFGADARLRLLEVMRLRGAHLPDSPTPAAQRDFAAAQQRCANCNSKELCDELLARGAKEGYGRFCPNAAYVEQLRSTSLEFDRSDLDGSPVDLGGKRS